MWIGSVTMDELMSRSRWKVELYCKNAPTVVSTAFRMAALGEIVDERKEHLSPQDYSEHTFNYLGLENVQPITGDLIDFTPRKGKEIRSRSKVFRRDDVLYGRLRPYLNKVYLAQGRVANGICSGEFHVLIPRSNLVLATFLRAVLASNYIQNVVSGLQTGSALPRLQLDDLLKIEVPLPPIDIQREYEAFLVSQDAHRRKVAFELAQLPTATIDAITAALQSGSGPVMSRLAELSVDEVDLNPLPSIAAMSTGKLPWADS